MTHALLISATLAVASCLSRLLAEDPDDEVRARAARALGRLGEPAGRNAMASGGSRLLDP
jgi:hypothetical protein